MDRASRQQDGCRRILLLAALFVVVYGGTFWILIVLGVFSGPPIIFTPFFLATISIARDVFNILGDIFRYFSSFPRIIQSLTSTSQLSGYRGQRRSSYYILNIVLITFLIILPAATVSIAYYAENIVCTPSPSTDGIGVGTGQSSLLTGIWNSALNHECIGISDGSFPFDTSNGRTDADLKYQAANNFNSPGGNAEPFWQQAIDQDSSDAEAGIYLEDYNWLTSAHITLVVATSLTGKYISVGRDNLQGAYIAQKEYNDHCLLPGCIKVRLLIANSGDNPGDAAQVAEQIKQLANVDKTVVGVIGWPFSAPSLSVLEKLYKAQLPMVSPTASLDNLTRSPYFFRVAPSNQDQATIGVQYATQKLHAKKAVVFEDPNDSDSKNLAEDFKGLFMDKSKGRSIVATEQYTAGKPEMLPDLLHNALRQKPDLIYFAGDGNDIGTLLASLPTDKGVCHLQVLGGNALYEVGIYLKNAPASLNCLHVTAFAFPGEWDKLKIPRREQTVFFNDYKTTFDPHNQHPGVYGYSLADGNAILSYDAAQVLLRGCQDILKVAIGGKQQFTQDQLRQGVMKLTSDALQQALTQVSGYRALQGVSGQIAFGLNGDPIHKAAAILYTSEDKGNVLFHLESVQGDCFLVGLCSSP